MYIFRFVLFAASLVFDLNERNSNISSVCVCVCVCVCVWLRRQRTGRIDDSKVACLLSTSRECLAADWLLPECVPSRWFKDSHLAMEQVFFYFIFFFFLQGGSIVCLCVCVFSTTITTIRQAGRQARGGFSLSVFRIPGHRTLGPPRASLSRRLIAEASSMRSRTPQYTSCLPSIHKSKKKKKTRSSN